MTTVSTGFGVVLVISARTSFCESWVVFAPNEAKIT
jgi:hypothetical protein